MTEKDFIFAWLLAAKSGAGTALQWHDIAIELQLREARKIYQLIEQETQHAANG